MAKYIFKVNHKEDHLHDRCSSVLINLKQVFVLRELIQVKTTDTMISSKIKMVDST